MRRIATALIAAACLPATTNAAEIYLCKAYNGATFWAQQSCNRHNALTERIESVANVPWAQQVQQAEQRRASNAATQDYANDLRCKQLYAELRGIEQRYERGYWQDVATVNQDQSRTRALRADLSANRCRTQ